MSVQAIPAQVHSRLKTGLAHMTVFNALLVEYGHEDGRGNFELAPALSHRSLTFRGAGGDCAADW